MSAERDVGKIAKTARHGQTDDGEARGAGMGGARGERRPVAVVQDGGSRRPACATESAAFGQRVRWPRAKDRLRAAQPDGRFVERRRRCSGVDQLQEFVGSASHQIHANTAQDQIRRITGNR